MEKENLLCKDAQECKQDGCGGWRYEEDCPHAGVFHANSTACKDCNDEAMDALSEVMSHKPII